MNLRSATPKTLLRVLLAGASLALAGTASTLAQGDAEWFDPTDWFDASKAKNVEADNYVYDFDYDYGLGDNFDYAVWSTYGRWGYEVWGPNDYDADYWDKQEWENTTASLTDPVGRPFNYVIYPDPQKSAKARQSVSPREKQAGKTDDRKPQRAESAQKQGQTEEGRKQVARLEGTVVGLRNLELRRESGATGVYTVAKVRLANEKNTVVNLGREAPVKDLNLKKGDAIEAIGRRGKIAGHNVFVAHRLKAGDRTIDANPTIRLSAEDQHQQTLTGTVSELKKASSNRGTPDHTLAELQLENGKSATVDLGPAASPEKIGLQQGDRITVRGQTEEQGDRKVLIPHLLKVESEQTSPTSKKGSP